MFLKRVTFVASDITISMCHVCCRGFQQQMLDRCNNTISIKQFRSPDRRIDTVSLSRISGERLVCDQRNEKHTERRWYFTSLTFHHQHNKRQTVELVQFGPEVKLKTNLPNIQVPDRCSRSFTRDSTRVPCQKLAQPVSGPISKSAMCCVKATVSVCLSVFHISCQFCEDFLLHF